MTYDSSTLSAEEFARACRQGLGRCVLALHRRPWRDFEGAVVDACLHHGGWDPQCECGRGQYVMDLIDRTHAADELRDRIIAALPTADGWDAEHQCEVIGRMARRGDAAARAALYRRVREGTVSGNASGTHDLVELDGIAGLIEAARGVGRWLRGEATRWEDDRLVRAAEEAAGEAAVWHALDAAAAADEDVGAYVQAVRHSRMSRTEPRPKPTQQSFYEVRARLAANQTDLGYWVGMWGRRASDDDLAQAAREVLRAGDSAEAARWLRAFLHRPFPLGLEPLLPLAHSGNDNVAWAALGALRNHAGPEVRAVAVECIGRGRVGLGEVRLLTRNFVDGDHRLVERAMALATTDAQMHDVGHDALDVFAENPTAACEHAMLKLYERGPCSLCRNGAVERLKSHGLVPQWMADECVYDSYEETRTIMADRGG